MSKFGIWQKRRRAECNKNITKFSTNSGISKFLHFAIANNISRLERDVPMYDRREGDLRGGGYMGKLGERDRGRKSSQLNIQVIGHWHEKEN